MRVTALLLFLGGAAFAADEKPTFEVDVSVVDVLATVRDRDGRIVSDLTRDDFILKEDGRVQEIRYFGPAPVPGAGGGVGTTLYDSVLLASDEVLREQAGRKAIILISDGVDHGSKVSIGDAIEAAQRADTIVYSIRYYDDEAYRRTGGGAGSDGKKALRRISEETGGRVFEVTRKLSLEQIYGQIQEELRNQYSIGYVPAGASGDGYRRIDLLTRDKKLEVHTRAGYYPKPL